MVENIHRAGMRETEIVSGMEQLALLGVSAAQIAKRTSIDRPTVHAALAVSKAGENRAKYEEGDLTLAPPEIGRASGRDRGGQSVSIWVDAVTLQTTTID